MSIKNFRLSILNFLAWLLAPKGYGFQITEGIHKSLLTQIILNEIEVSLNLLDLIELAETDKAKIYNRSLDSNFDKDECANMLSGIFMNFFASEVKPLAGSIQQKMFELTPQMSMLPYSEYVELLSDVNDSLDAFYDKAKDHVWDIIYLEIEKVTETQVATAGFFQGVVGDA